MEYIQKMNTKFDPKKFQRNLKIRKAFRFAGLVGLAMFFVSICLLMLFTGFILVTGDGVWLAKAIGIGCGFIAFMLLLLPMILMLDTSS